MFKDERIDQCIGKIYRKTMILFTFFSLFYLIVTSIFQFSLVSIINPIVVLISSLIILIYGEFILNRKTIKDERYYSIKSNYYQKAMFSFILSTLVGFIIAVILSFKYPNSNTTNSFLLFMEVISFLFINYQIKKNEINFNYSFINLNNGGYYKRVFKNILKLLVYISIIYLIIFFISLIIFFNFKLIISFLIIYITSSLISFVSLSLLYLVLSWMEKINYDEMDQDSKYFKGMLISLIIALSYAFTLIYLITYAIALSKGDIHVNNNQLGTLISNINIAVNYLTYYQIIFFTYAISILFFHLKSTSRSYKWVNIINIYFLISVLYRIFSPIILSSLALHFNNAQSIQLITSINYYLSILFTLIFNLALLLLFINLVKEYQYRKWIIFAIIFFTINDFICSLLTNEIHYLYIYTNIIYLVKYLSISLILVKRKGRIYE